MAGPTEAERAVHSSVREISSCLFFLHFKQPFMIGPNLRCMLFGSAGVVLEILDSLFKASSSSGVGETGVRFGFDLFHEQQSNQTF